MLAPAVRPGDVAVMDNLAAQKVAGVHDAIRAAGASVLYLPPYSPDLNPISWPTLGFPLPDGSAASLKPSARPSPARR